MWDEKSALKEEVSQGEIRGRKTHLNSDVETWDVEGLEHDLCCVLSVLRRVERRLRLKRQTHFHSPVVIEFHSLRNQII